ncbi:peptidase family M1-domain-containing protein [Dimargaris cristalligena]|uniref:Peptidase family M1-domain-containing protein n=1 Tax=Dimargaris cristalligena TaxID=215637 RepID=A0A4P9ZS93_9FUNG|nr:peptidase family M1-domain-containing protein [Dimargaris cristalligena]|eukprot:RKP36275.1 peptidase family M1-domain-containing protein [Dimargaris cristalligena]
MSADPTSFANTHECFTRHLHLDLNVDFNRSILTGHAIHQVQVADEAEAVREVIFDTKHLVIHSVRWSADTSDDQASFQTADYHLGEPHPKFGRALHVRLPQELPGGSQYRVRIDYETTPASSALQFLTPDQTAGKQHPYLFTQCQAIHARTMVPCQDTPGAPKPLKALMSALSTGQRDVAAADGKGPGSTIYEFAQRTTMPSYLLALVVGNLEGREIGPRSTVWTEPEVVEAAAWEFVDTEKFISTAEALLTPYQWGRYDLLVVPPSFPFGGMENPCLTFVTPTLLAGDRSLVDVVAHEIAHSWTGNLVTTKDWSSFWLNEGWTVFVERKILGRLHGEATRQFSAILGWKELETAVAYFGPKHPFTALLPDLTNEDPDDAFSTIPYEKGFNLLFYLENHLGGPSVFEPYMKAYIRNFAGQSIDAEQWKSFLYYYMNEYHPAGEEEAKRLLDQVDWHAWLHGPGMPPVTPQFDQTLMKDCESLAQRWHEAAQAETDSLSFGPDDIVHFTTDQKSVLLELLRDDDPFPHSIIEAMDKAYQFSGVRNAEIRFRWQMLCLRATYTAIFPHVVTFVLEQGRMKFVRPLYRSLYTTNAEGAQLARDTFSRNKKIYHPIAAAQLEKDLDLV